MSSIRILADENIPCVEAAFGGFGTVETRPGRSIEAADVREVDVLLVRSVTPVGPALLEGSAVRFVGSATVGTDHVDRDFLASAGVAFAHAPGSNADSVADYVVAALLALAVRTGRPLAGQTAGIVGVGNIGGRLARRLPALGMEVRLNDPPRAEAAERRGDAHPFEELGAVLAGSDVVTLHVPLTTDGRHPTRHLAGRAFLDRMPDGAWFVNAARGEVADGAALCAAADRLGGLVLDVWENEPTPDPDLLRRADVATPHIAGYARDGKVRGTAMLYDALCEHLGKDPGWTPDAALAPETPGGLRCTPPDPRLPRTEWLHALARQGCDVLADDARLRPILDRPPGKRGAFFSRLRRTYPTRRELQQHVLARPTVPPGRQQAAREGLGVQLDTSYARS
jgi:erythronate-4-phosphate dehydrogenase